MKKKYSSLCDLNNESIFNSLLRGIDGSEKRQHLLDLLIDACRFHSDLFSDDFWFEEFDGDYPIEYVLPALRRAYASFFIQIPPLLKNDKRRIELFQLNFNLEEFLTEVSTKSQTVKRLSEFEHIDKAATVLQLIVDNYVGEKIKMTRVDNLTQTIREIKIEKHLKL